MAGPRWPYRCMAAAPLFALGLHGEALAASDDTTQHDKPSAELDVSVEYASSYVFRGLNLFRNEDQGEHKGVLIPRVSWTAEGGSLSLGYLSAYQLNGDNIQENVRAGVGRAQILYADYGIRVSPHWLVTPEVSVIAYPWAKPAEWFSEASTEARTHFVFDVAMNVGYLFAVQRHPSPSNQLYLSLRASKSVPLLKDLSFDFGLGAGVKFLRPEDASKDNQVDVLLSEGFSYSLGDAAYIGIHFAFAWTNLGPRQDPETLSIIRPGFIDELVPFWSLVIGAEASGSEKIVPIKDFSRRRSVQ